LSLIVSVFEDDGTNVDLYRMPVERVADSWTAGAPVPITDTPESEGFALVASRSGYIAAFVVPAGCAPYSPDVIPGCEGRPRVLDAEGNTLLDLPGDVFPYAWAPGGDALLVGRRTADAEFPGVHELQLVDVADGASATVWSEDGFAVSGTPAFSPDGTRLAVPVTDSPYSGGGEFLQVTDLADGSQVYFSAAGYSINYPAWRNDDELWAIGFDYARLAQDLLAGVLPDGSETEATMAVQPAPAKAAESQFSWSPGGQWLAVSLYLLSEGEVRELPVLHLSSDALNYRVVGAGPDVRIHWRPSTSAPQ
jgi:hypothetical protein